MNKTIGTHGTIFREGQTDVRPAVKAKVAPNFSESDPKQAYYSAHYHGNPVVAQERGWAWANQVSRMTEQPGRPVVHEVTPLPGSKVDQDPYTKKYGDASGGSLVSNRGLAITDTHWIPPVHPYAAEREGVIGHQGTLPHVNWNQFGPQDGEQRNWEVLRR